MITWLALTAFAADPVLVVASQPDAPLVLRLEAELRSAGLEPRSLPFDPAPSSELSFVHDARAVLRVEPELVSLWTPTRRDHLALTLDDGSLGLSATEALLAALQSEMGPDFSPLTDLDRPVRELDHEVLVALLAQSPVLDAPEATTLAHERRLESIRILRELLASGANGERAIAMMRLAELYLEEARYLHLQEMEKELSCDGCKVARDSQRWRTQALRLYEMLLRSYPHFQRADEALYYMATAYADAGLPDQAIDAHTRLVRQYPDSTWAPDAWVALGEAYFEQDDAVTARRAYARAARADGHPKQVFATYKLAWCLYNLGEYGEAIDAMQRVVKASESRLGQRDEALRDLVRFFADADLLDEGEAYFSALGQPALTRSLLARMASLASEQGKHDDAVVLYRKLLATAAESPAAMTHQLSILAEVARLDDDEALLAEIDLALARFGPESRWARQHNNQIVSMAQDDLARFVERLSLDAHKRAEKLRAGAGARRAQALAGAGYARFLAHFPEHPQAAEVRFAAGELAFSQQDFPAALTLYTQVTEGPRARFCAEAAVHAARAWVGERKGSWEAPEQALLDAADRFVAAWPEDDKAQAIAFSAARLAYDRGRLDEAATRFEAVVAMEPSHPRAEQSVHLRLDILVQQQDIVALHDNAERWRQTPGLGSPMFKAELARIVRRSALQLAQARHEAGDSRGAAADADAWLTTWSDEAAPELIAQALHNAAVYHQAAAQPLQALAKRRRLIEDSRFGPDTAHWADDLAALGYGLEGLARFAEAAGYYERLFTEVPTHPGAADALFSAAVFRRALGEHQQAAQDFRTFWQRFPSDGRASEAALAEALEQGELGDWASADEALAAYLRRDGLSSELMALGVLHRGKALTHLGRDRERDALYQRAIADFERLPTREPGHALAVAEMMYTLSGPLLQQFLAARIGQDLPESASPAARDRALQASLTRKARALTELESHLTQVIRTGAGRWGLASLVALGTAYEDMGTALVEAQVPDHLTPEQRQLYQARIEQEVFSFRERASQAYATALNKSHELGLHGALANQALTRLSALRPDDYGISEALPTPGYTTLPR